MLCRFLDSAFEREGDSELEARSKALWARLACVAIVVNGALAVVRRALPSEGDDGELELQWICADVMHAYLHLMLSYNLIHLYCFGITPFLKVALIVNVFLWVTIQDVCFSPQPWVFMYVLILDFCVLMQTGRDEALIGWVSAALRALMLLYIVVKTLAGSGRLPDIHPFEESYQLEGQLVAIVVPLALNFAQMKAYAASAREEARSINDAEKMFSRIAEKLANFDLEAAERLLLLQADHESPIYQPLYKLHKNLHSYRPFLPNSLFAQEEDVEPPNDLIAESMRGEFTMWHCVRSAVTRMRDPKYSLWDFHRDVTSAFPELKLYEDVGTDDTITRTQSFSSGRTPSEEYQRTLGAMYSVYCLARLDMGGKELFAFGVDENWNPRTAPEGEDAEKKRDFYESLDWDSVRMLLVRANLLTVIYPSSRERSKSKGTNFGSEKADKGTPKLQYARTRTISKRSGSWVTAMPSSGNVSSSGSSEHVRLAVNYDRMTALLVLTAVHDVMKNVALLPVVQKRHAPYQDIPEGCEISDHDVALAYVLENFPALLPSYHGLEPAQRAPVLFTQGKMGFNNGWLVQGEAPPGALFSKFKRVVVEGCASESDIGFYFTHWLTDLAGAEPHGSRPWPGSEKFATMFPTRVLNSFLDSFFFVDSLASKSEVEVMETYLTCRWQALGPPSMVVKEDCSLAAMRLALMAQGFEAEVVAALHALSRRDRDVIAAEMARTGTALQFDTAPAAVRAKPAGPALLVYYAPALVQKAGATQAVEALQVLAAVYRASRKLFPLDTGPSAVESTVVIRIDALKVLTPSDIAAAQGWHLRRTSSTYAEAVCGLASKVEDDGIGVAVAHIDTATQRRIDI